MEELEQNKTSGVIGAMRTEGLLWKKTGGEGPKGNETRSSPQFCPLILTAFSFEEPETLDHTLRKCECFPIRDTF